MRFSIAAMNFFEATGVARAAGGETANLFRVTVPDGWQQGPGAFGGWVLAAMIRSIEAVVPDLPLRSLTAEIPSPVMVGDATISVDLVRAGQSVSVVTARLMQDAELRAHAVTVMGLPRRVPPELDHVDLRPPQAPPWRDTPSVPADNPILPTFARHFEFRPVVGLPFTGGAAMTTGWVRARDPGPVRDAALVVGHVDAWYPAEFARFTAGRRIVTAAFTLQVVGGAQAWTGDGPLLHTSRSLAAEGGYVTEARQLWTEEGRLVALNQQTMVIVK